MSSLYRRFRFWGRIAVALLVLWGGSLLVNFDAGGEPPVPKASSDVRALVSAVNLFVLDHERLPTTLEELVEPPAGTLRRYVQALPMDPWGNPYQYTTERPSHVQEALSFYIWSNGADGVVGGTGFDRDSGNWSDR